MFFLIYRDQCRVVIVCGKAKDSQTVCAVFNTEQIEVSQLALLQLNLFSAL